MLEKKRKKINSILEDIMNENLYKPHVQNYFQNDSIDQMVEQS